MCACVQSVLFLNTFASWVPSLCSVLCPNFEDVEGTYWFGPVRASVCLSVRLYICLSARTPAVWQAERQTAT